VESLTFVLVVLNLLSFLGMLHLVFELLSHFRVQYSFFFLLSVLYFLLVKRKVWLTISLIGLCLNGMVVAKYYLSGTNDNSAGTQLKVLFSNVHSSNKNHQAILDTIQRLEPDIVALAEINKNWLEDLKPLRQRYLHYKETPRSDNFGIALYSKYPLENVNLISFVEHSDYSVLSILADIKMNKKLVHIVATHSLPPISAAYIKERNKHIKSLSQWVKDKQNPVIVMGDLNMTMWSPYYDDLEDAGLFNARQGFGILPTWPAKLPFFKIPIDHILYTKGISVNQVSVEAEVGSDHFPLFSSLVIH
jgi:endonuclease/exonuclease/phosphatase (EEP) superfamily protein YafD